MKCNDFPVEKRSLAQPVWDGSPLNGKTIFLYAEQGFGDTIQFIRYVYELTRYKVDIIVECQSELLDLFRNIGIIAQLIVQGDALPDFDVHAPLLSLPRIFGTDNELTGILTKNVFTFIIFPVDELNHLNIRAQCWCDCAFAGFSHILNSIADKLPEVRTTINKHQETFKQ